MTICSKHVENLLINWKIHPFANKYTHGKVLTCSLPKVGFYCFRSKMQVLQIVHEKKSHWMNERPRTQGRLNKEDTLSFIASTGKFCMVGTG